IRRTADGSFAFQTGQSDAPDQSIAEVLERVDNLFATPALEALSTVEAEGIVLSLEDARSGRIWQATNAQAIFRRTDSGLSVSINSDVFNGTDQVAGIQLSMSLNRATRVVDMGIRVEDMPGLDIAQQAPVLSFLSVLDAPISGSMRTQLDAEGAVSALAGTLDIAGGALRPDPGTPPVAFQSAKAYFTFDPDQQRIDFSEVSFVAEDGALLASGHSYLAELDGSWPQAFLGQFQVESATFDGGDVFDGPVALANLSADLRLRLDPFTVEIPQIAIDNEGTPITANALIEARDEGWHASVDATTPVISSERVLAFWPRAVAPITRGWLSNNLRAGTLRQTSAALRFHSGEKPNIGLSFNFEGGTVKFLREMPALTGAAGRAELTNNRFSLALEDGQVVAGTGDVINAAGSHFTIADTRPKPVIGVIDLATTGALQGSLSILNNPPLRIMERAGRGIDIAEATTEVRASVTIPLKDGILRSEVNYEVDATLRDVSSIKVAEGRSLTSPLLSLKGNTQALGVTGRAALDGVPLRVDWRQPLGAGAANGARVTGTVALSQQTIDAFDLPLPAGLISGNGQGSFDLALPNGAPPRLDLTSNLAGLRLSVPAIGYTKSADSTGAFSLSAILGDVPQVEALSLESSGLSLQGTLEFDDTGGFDGAAFERVQVGSWLDASVNVRSQPNGAPDIALTGGTFDLRRFSGLSGSGGGSGGARSDISLRLDRLIVSDGIALAPINGIFSPVGGGLSGSFEGRVNGNTPVRGTLSPSNAGTALRVQAANAGGVLRDAGLTPNTSAGTLDLILTPVRDGPGTYDGQFLIEDIRLRNAPFMADLLDAVSVVGLIDQLSGPGIAFSSVDGRFRLNRRRIQLQQLAAVGGSLGISADGIYDFAQSRMDIRGVISPVYFLNGIGSFLTRRGEGLFGFNYRVTGSAANPNVGVNPLSILTPGAFRELFRSAPPGG
ncbi:MAG: AsmA-like C-terminal region-containing protein, partial [Paracoccaceae bacterium]